MKGNIPTPLTGRMIRLQISIWVIFYLFLLLYTLQKWEFPRFGFWAATIATVFYIVAVYVNSAWLIPKWYLKGRRVTYFILSLAILSGLLLLRMEIEYIVLLPMHQKFYSWTLSHFSFVFITNFLAFAFGALLRVSIDHLSLLKQQEEMRTIHARTELSLLKSQVQPHFLFNTLNNIYYLAYTRDQRTADVIAKLSDIMRFFVDEAPKERILLGTELNFITNYMELEQIRMQYPVDIRIEKNGVDEAQLIPPMLLIPLIENIFKHGIDKSREDNFAEIIVSGGTDWLMMKTANRVAGSNADGPCSGLENLRKRLQMLFGDRFELKTWKEDGLFKAIIKFEV